MVKEYQGARVERVVADVDPRNEASLGVLKRFGFGEVGRAEVCFPSPLSVFSYLPSKATVYLVGLVLLDRGIGYLDLEAEQG